MEANLPGGAALISTAPDEVSERQKVVGVEWRGHLKEIRLRPRGSPLLLPRSACVSTGDTVILTPEGIVVPCRNGEARLYPSYLARETIRIGKLSLDLLVKEITEEDEFAAYQALADLHYRGKALHGRTARLIVRNFHPMYPSVVGYIELATPFYMNKPRSRLLNAPFSVDGVGWLAWDMPTLRRYIHLLVRIARCVVFPEFRGLGFGQLLIKHAAQFGKDHWQVAGLKPYFLEISADMLKFVPFSERAGMVFIGETEGNLARVAKDLRYLLANQSRINGDVVHEEACGIVDQQVARMTRAAQLMHKENWGLDELTKRLESLARKGSLKTFSLFSEIVSLPKPTYLRGLTADSHAFVLSRAADLSLSNGSNPPKITIDPLTSRIEIVNLAVCYESSVRRTRRTHVVQQAFGISPDTITHDVVRHLSLQIGPGQVLLVTGPSGSGKTSLLSVFLRQVGSFADGVVRFPANYGPGCLARVRSEKPLIELLGTSDVKVALHLMGIVGLSMPSST